MFSTEVPPSLELEEFIAKLVIPLPPESTDDVPEFALSELISYLRP